ncbi:hypothetical protein ACGFR8_07670 [Streptomyces brevispora]|uniref:hypothetical protein n=1 Tax=Streptomyces brevispora TaxID=887462 RepID=UPI00371E710B
MNALIAHDPTTGLRRGPVRWPDGTPPPPFGCRRCGHDTAVHGAGAHQWERPTNPQILARMRARRRARAEERRLTRVYVAFCRAAFARDVQEATRCDEMAHNSVGAETFCTQDDPDHDGLCDDGEGFLWLGVRNEERGQ